MYLCEIQYHHRSKTLKYEWCSVTADTRNYRLADPELWERHGADGVT
jgi:hypothetical protein